MSRSEIGAWMGMFAFVLDNILTNALVPLLPDLRMRLDVSIETTGWILTARSLTQLLHSLFVVSLVIHRFGLKGTMVLSCVLQVGTCLLTGFAENVGVFIVAQIAHGIGGSCFSTASVALIAQGGASEQGRLMALLYSGVAWGSIVGTGIGGLLYAQFGQLLLFLGIAVLMGVLGVVMFIVLGQDSVSSSPAVRPSLPTPRVLLKLIRHPEIFKCMGLIALSNFFIGGFLVLLPAKLADAFSWKSSDIGLAMTAGPFLYILASYSIDRLINLLDSCWLARLSVGISSAAFLLLLVQPIEKNISAVIGVLSILYAATALVQIVQPGNIAAVLHRSGLDIPQTAGAALVDVAIGCGYTSMVLTAWVRAQGGFRFAFLYAGGTGLSGLILTRRSRVSPALASVRMASEED